MTDSIECIVNRTILFDFVLKQKYQISIQEIKEKVIQRCNNLSVKYINGILPFIISELLEKNFRWAYVCINKDYQIETSLSISYLRSSRKYIIASNIQYARKMHMIYVSEDGRLTIPAKYISEIGSVDSVKIGLLPSKDPQSMLIGGSELDKQIYYTKYIDVNVEKSGRIRIPKRLVNSTIGMQYIIFVEDAKSILGYNLIAVRAIDLNKILFSHKN